MAKRQQRDRKRKSRSPRSRRNAEVDVKEHLIDHDDKVDAASAGSRTTAAPAAGGPTEPGLFALLPRETREVLAQAMLLFSASSLRQYAGLVETLGRHVPDLAQVLAGGEMSEAEGAEQLRACLREVADMSIEEARRLRAQIDGLDRHLAPPAAVDGSYWRRWKAKP